MMTILFWLLFASVAQAQELLLAQAGASLQWSYQAAPASCTSPTPTASIQTSTNGMSGWNTVASYPVIAGSGGTYALPTTANNLYYRVTTACGQSNMVQYVAATPPPTDPTVDQRLTAVETKNAAQDLALNSLGSNIATIGSQLIAAEGRIADLTQRLTALENPPAPTSNISVKVISADVVEVTCINSTSMKTTGTGLKRTITCNH